MAGSPVQHDVAACARAWQTLRLAHARVAERLETDLERECGLALNEFDVLLYLRARRDRETCISDLLDAVTLSQPALSRLVARLEARGLVARSGAHHDARATAVCLTDAGAALIDRAIQVHAMAVHETLTSKFSEAEQAALLQLLSQIGN